MENKNTLRGAKKTGWQPHLSKIQNSSEIFEFAVKTWSKKTRF